MDQTQRPPVFLIEAPLLQKVLDLMQAGIYPEHQVKEVNHYIRALTMLPKHEPVPAPIHQLHPEE